MKSKKKLMLKISAVYLIGKAEIPIHYTTWGQVEQALLSDELTQQRLFKGYSRVHISSDEVFSTILKKPSPVQK